MTATSSKRVYTSTRVRGLASWKPQKETRHLLIQVQAVLEEYADHLPLTCRQIFYRGEALHEAIVVVDNGADLRLLQHDLRYPDPIRIYLVLPG